jgi:YbbR domain-containing protein
MMRVTLFQNFGLKVLSIALAVLVWGLVAGQREAERSLRVPLEYRNIPEQLELLGEPASLVDVRLRGTSGALGQLRGTDLVAVMDLHSARPGRRLFHLLPDNVVVPTGVTVLQVSPATLSLTFEASAVRTVPVVPDIDDEPAPGYEVAHVAAEPATVVVSGPSSAVSSVTEATTEPVSVRGATKPVIDTVTVGVPDSIVRLRSSRSAIVTVDIRPVRVERVITEVPVTFRSAAAGIHATSQPAEIAVRIKGAASAVSAIRPGDLQVYADLSGLVRGRYNLPVRFDQLADVVIVGVEPAQLDVRLR